MDWLILILGIPAILIPLVLLVGFAGCTPSALPCREDLDCASGFRCVDETCVDAGTFVPQPPSAPENLAARALDDRSVLLTWTNTDPATTDFQIERTPDGGDDFEPISPSGNVSPTGTTDDSAGLQEGVTYIYRVRALVDEVASEPSDTSSATVFPAAPVNLAVTATSFDRIELSWTNASAVATEFSLERSVSGGTFAEIIPGPGINNTFSDTGLVEGTQYEYRVFAIVVDGFQNDVAEEVRSAESGRASATTLAFTAVFALPPGTLTTDGAGVEGFCIVQRLIPTLLAAGGTQVRMRLRGSTTGSLTLDRVTISQLGPTGDPYDAAPDLTDVASGVTIPPNTTVTVGPVNYTLDRTRDLLIAFDISNTPGEGNRRFGALTGADSFASPATAEAGVQDRTTGYPDVAANTHHFVERIEVL